jgi:CRP/FNR family transcriptional regulator
MCPTRRLCAASDLRVPALEALSEYMSTTAPMTISVTSAGEEYVTGFYYPGEILGLDGAASGRFGDTAMALTSATACRMAHADLPHIWTLGAGPSLLRLIAEHEQTEAKLRINLSQTRAEMRIAGFLKLLMERTERMGFDPTCLTTPMSRTDLANHLGLTLECVSRVFGKWRKAGVIDTDRNSLKVLEPDALATTAFHLAA